MIRLIDTYTFYSKKQFLFLLFMIILIIVLSLLIYDDAPYVEQLMYQDTLNLYYHQSTQRLYLWMLPFIYQMLLMDHDQPYIKPFEAYFGKTIVLSYKLIFYILLMAWMTFIFFCLYHILPYLWTDYYVMTDLFIRFFVNLYLDSLLLLIITFLLIRIKYQAFSFILPIFYMLYAFLLEDTTYRIFYLFLPIFLPLESFKSLEFIYKICYIFTGFIMIYIQSAKNKY